jgi:hypothetical protein
LPDKNPVCRKKRELKSQFFEEDFMVFSKGHFPHFRNMVFVSGVET